MNRANRRKVDKIAKKKLTDEQYEKFKNGAVQEAVTKEANRKFALFIESFVLVMRKNRISEERINKILDDFEELVSKEGIRA